MSEFATGQLPPGCVECPTARFLKDAYDESSIQESALMRTEAEAWEIGEEEVARICSSALAKIVPTRKITEAGLNGLQHCPGFKDKCGLENE